ncbi:DNA-binding transcriptional regulator, AcrR family [Pseudarcicella hirudinis]|uniref:DNA-binding transcriptional regulator, AcrR family n=1 Tax=Pseudarcicella hirudinis TaxID=1079859 RepID=A0A1I5TUM4_9BACT|nr:TetR/AcrR family transcriptional regulator [Pseudarcicella hirudinis]SFP86006.1 DNA-binding transcriptional regulator, AcrR family [Pseudarcicella hirudinis]
MTRNEILRESMLLFGKYGVKSVTMNDISHKLGISKKTLYSFIDNKEDLVIECIEMGWIHFEQIIRTIKMKENNPMIVLAGIYQGILRELAKIKSSYFFDLRKNYNANEKFMNCREKLKNNHLIPLLNQAKNDRLIRHEIDEEILCKVFFFLVDDFIAENNYFYARTDLTGKYMQALLLGIKGMLTPMNEDLLNECLEKIS